MSDGSDSPWKASCRACRAALIRVMNAARALVLLSVPSIPGAMTLEMKDEQIAENSGCFTIRRALYKEFINPERHVIDTRETFDFG